MHKSPCNFLVALLTVLAPLQNLRGEERDMRLRLKDGSFSIGRLAISQEPNRLGWNAPGLEETLHFDLRAIRSVSAMFQNAETPDYPADSQLIELTDGSVIAGRLLQVTENEITVDSSLLGKLTIVRSRVLSFTDAGYAGQVVYSGPKDDGKWKSLNADLRMNVIGPPDSNVGDWEFEAGSLVAGKPEVGILGNVDLPIKSQVNLALSWKGVADFVFSIGTADAINSPRNQISAAARLEVWDEQLALVREVPGNADIALISDLTGANSRVEITLFIDQEAGTVTACDSHGRPLETITAVATEKVVGSSVHLMNHGPSLTLEHIEVREWDGRTSTAAAMGDLNVVDDQGQVIEGAVSGFDPESSSVTIELSGTHETVKLPISSIRRGDFLPTAGQPNDSLDNPSKLTDDDPKTQEIDNDDVIPQIEIVLTDRTRLWGRWLPTKAAQLQLQVEGVTAVSSDATTNVSFLPGEVSGVIGSSKRYVSDHGSTKTGSLKLAESQLAGYLEESSPADTLTAMYWHPYSSSNSSQILPTASGAIVYRNTLPKVTTTANSARTALQQPFIDRVPSDEQTNALSNGEPALSKDAREIMFRSGDAIDGIVESIDEKGMVFKSNQTRNTFAGHEQIQSIWLNRLQKSLEPSVDKMARLMTVPRAMKNDPPTHLLIAVTGDYLRGRLIGMNKDSVTVEVRLEVMEIPRQQVAQIIWLHDRDWGKEDGGEKDPDSQPAEAIAPFQVHGTYGIDRGLTFEPKSMRAGILAGTSQLLGDCSLDLSQISQLLFGRDIAHRVREFREDPWTLSLAQYPRVYLDDGTEGGAVENGLQSPLVGMAAPEFMLKGLDGQPFRLSKHRDRIVVLDFWASWCGPCIQTMPLVDEVVSDIGEDKVELVAVNIQETPNRVAAAVERLGLSASVLLDVDGQVAAAYAANAIPQTVIVDREGNVTHLFVGGGPRFIAQFKLALESLLVE